VYLLGENVLNSVPLGVCFSLVVWDVLDITWDSCRSAKNTRVVGTFSVNLGYALFLDRCDSVPNAIDNRHRNIILVASLHVLIRNEVK